jgi:hypothetical protein
MSRSRGLPSPTSLTPLSQVLDTLTDPGTAGAPVTSDVSGDGGNSARRKDVVSSGTPGASGPSVTSDDRGNTGQGKLAPRDHVKLRQDLAAEMRDAVWFLSEHGRPRVQLGELLDEAVQGWLAEAKKTYNGGHDFPHRGRLR